MQSFFKTSLNDTKRCIESSSPDTDWSAASHIGKTYDIVLTEFDDQYLRALDDIDYIFGGQDDVACQTEETINLLKKWEQKDYPVCMAAIIAASAEKLGFSEQDYISPLLMASVLAGVPNAQEYHNNLHFRKVVLHVVRMIVVHNKIFAGTRNILDKKKMAMLMIAAAIHDLGHKGEGNIIDRKYHMAKVEQRSFDIAQPYLKATGLSGDILQDIRIMLMATDASPFGDPISPTNQARRAFEYHYGSAEEENGLDLAGDLEILEKRSDLSLLCLMLHEADIMNSAGVSYEITRGESIAISKEIGREHALPEDTLLFLEKICASQMLSDAARYLGDDNLKAILQSVVADYENGNRSYM